MVLPLCEAGACMCMRLLRLLNKRTCLPPPPPLPPPVTMVTMLLTKRPNNLPARARIQAWLVAGGGQGPLCSLQWPLVVHRSMQMHHEPLEHARPLQAAAARLCLLLHPLPHARLLVPTSHVTAAAGGGGGGGKQVRERGWAMGGGGGGSKWRGKGRGGGRLEAFYILGIEHLGETNVGHHCNAAADDAHVGAAARA